MLRYSICISRKSISLAFCLNTETKLLHKYMVGVNTKVYDCDNKRTILRIVISMSDQALTSVIRVGDDANGREKLI